MTSLSGGVGIIKSTRTMVMLAACPVSAQEGLIGGRRAKVTTNDRRYSASGITQRSGAEATSVVMYEVTPSRRLEGTKASPIHNARARQWATVPVVTPMAAGPSP